MSMVKPRYGLVPLEDIRKATDDFHEKNIIGRGGFGIVYKGKICHSNGDDLAVAVKRFQVRFGQGKREFWAEVSTLSNYAHKNVISLVGYYDDNREMILVYELASNESLDRFVSKNVGKDPLTWIQLLNICIGAASGLNHLHTGVGPQHRVIHRDVKSSNILLDENLEAKISDFGLSKMTPANQPFTRVVTNPVGSLPYCDPVYVETGRLTEKCDVYSFGVVLFEVLSGRPAFIETYHDERRLLSNLVKHCIQEQRMNEVMNQSLMKEMKLNSLKTFIEIAYQCLQERQDDRPLMSEVVKKLKLSLKLQENMDEPPLMRADETRRMDEEIDLANLGLSDSDMVWEKKLPSDYREIIKKSDSLLLYTSKKELYSILTKGVLIGNPEMLFFLLNGKRCHKIPASKITNMDENNPNVRNLNSVHDESRFSYVVEIFDAAMLEMKGEISTQMLTLKAIYVAYLVFKRRFGGFDDPVSLHWKINKPREPWSYETSTDPENQFPRQRADGWMEIELWEFFNDTGDEYFEFQLWGIDQNYGIIVEGIEFRPKEIASRSDVASLSLQTLPSDYQEMLKTLEISGDYSSKEEIYKLFSEGIFVDEGKMWFWLRNGKKCHMQSIKDCSIIQNYWNWISKPGSRFSEVLEIDDVSNLNIHGKNNTRMLSPNTNYVAYLVFKLGGRYSRLEDRVEISWTFTKGTKTRTESMSIVFLKSANRKQRHKRVPVEREDGWMETELWDFFVYDLEGNVSLDFELKGTYQSRRDYSLIVDGIEYRPKEFVQENSA